MRDFPTQMMSWHPSLLSLVCVDFLHGTIREPLQGERLGSRRLDTGAVHVEQGSRLRGKEEAMHRLQGY